MLYISKDKHDVDEIQSRLSRFQEKFPHQLHVIDIDRDDVLQETYAKKAPVLDVGVYRMEKSFNTEEIEHAFRKAEERLQEAKSKGNDLLVRRMTEPLQMTKADRFSRWFSNHYMVLLNLFSFFYVFLALLAPTLMEIGWERPGRAIYTIYRPLCHQLAFRSFFMFGEQPFYPRELAAVEGYATYGEATGFNENDLVTARNFLGNETLGYKMALCERDIAIYGVILLFGLVFSLTGKKIKPLPWYLWVLIGLGPIGLDGFSQLLSQTGLGIFEWLPLRESTPFLRSLTGGLFGLATAWFGFPYLEESVIDNRREMRIKHRITAQINMEQE
ncbi:MAG: DUF2085 domain-containing protein [Brevefilum sp.]